MIILLLLILEHMEQILRCMKDKEKLHFITIPKGTYSNGVFAQIVTNLLVTVLIDPTTNDMMQSENWMCPFNTQYFASKNAWSFNSTKPNTTSPWPGVGPGPFLVKQNDMRNQFKFVKDGLPPNILPETSFCRQARSLPR